MFKKTVLLTSCGLLFYTSAFAAVPDRSETPDFDKSIERSKELAKKKLQEQYKKSNKKYVIKKESTAKKSNKANSLSQNRLDKRIDLLLKKFEEEAGDRKKKREEKRSLVKTTNKAKALLPEPYKAMLIGNYVAVFAKLKVPVLSPTAMPEEGVETTNNVFGQQSVMSGAVINGKKEGGINVANPASSLRRNMSSLNKRNNLKYEEKDIRLYYGSEFNGWYVKKLTLHYVVFENPDTKEKVKKYF